MEAVSLLSFTVEPKEIKSEFEHSEHPIIDPELIHEELQVNSVEELQVDIDNE